VLRTDEQELGITYADLDDAVRIFDALAEGA